MNKPEPLLTNSNLCFNSVPPSKDEQPFLLAARGMRSKHTPVWFMRQAGRSLPEYRKLRKQGSILDSIRVPELAAEITLQPVQRYGVDAAILYSDIMVPLCAMGAGVDIKEGVGPVLAEPYQTSADLSRLRDLEPETDIPYVLETIQILCQELEVPLIGFAGAPFTLASYLVEGGPSKNYLKTKTLMLAGDSFFQELMSKLADIVITTLRAQVNAGAAALQLFDSWVGALSPNDYERYILIHTKRIFQEVSDLNVPLIHFGVGTGELLSLMSDTGVDVVGVDWRVPLGQARKRASSATALQGNLDPALCLAPWDKVEAGVLEVLEENAGHPGHIFNLGHGVLPETNPDTLARIVDLVHSHTSTET